MDIRTFAIITTDANELVAEIHDRMPLILAPADYARWLSDEPDPRDLMRPYPAEPMRMWPISIRVNKPENDDPSIVEPIELAGPFICRRLNFKPYTQPDSQTHSGNSGPSWTTASPYCSFRSATSHRN